MTIIVNRKMFSDSLKQESEQMGERRDCTVRAIAHVCHVPYKEAHAALKKFGRQDRKGCYEGTQAKAVGSLGYDFLRIFTPQGARTFKTVAAAMQRAGRGTGTYLIYCRGHVAPMVDGEVYDWAACSRRRIIMIVHVTPKNSLPPVIVPQTPFKKKRTHKPELSNKAIVWKAWTNGVCSPNALLTLVDGIKLTTVKGWLSCWKRGKNLPAIAK